VSSLLFDQASPNPPGQVALLADFLVNLTATLDGRLTKVEPCFCAGEGGLPAPWEPLKTSGSEDIAVVDARSVARPRQLKPSRSCVFPISS
jgi:hypothetical protein